MGSVPALAGARFRRSCGTSVPACSLHLAAADNGFLRSKMFFATDLAQRRSNPKLDCLGTGANQRFVSGKETDNANATGTTQREDLLQVLQVPELDETIAGACG